MLILDQDAGTEQKELGLWAVELNNADFVAKARRVTRELSLRYGSVTVDQVRTHPDMQGLTPSSSHTYGAIFHEPGWRFVSYERSQLKSNRARRISRWRWRP